LAFINWYNAQINEQYATEIKQVSSKYFEETVNELMTDMENEIKEKRLTREEVNKIFFNTNLQEIDLDKYINYKNLTGSEVHVFDVNTKTVSKGDIYQYYNVEDASINLDKKTVIDILVE
jgi:hypothetical protein